MLQIARFGRGDLVAGHGTRHQRGKQRLQRGTLLAHQILDHDSVIDRRRACVAVAGRLCPGAHGILFFVTAASIRVADA